MTKEKYITVLNKQGVIISKCTKRRAHQLITRKSGHWVGWNTLQLFYDSKDKKLFREEAMKRDNYTCYIPTCQKKMWPGHPDLSADHIRSRAKGGTDLTENLACCCKQCNEEKGNMDLEDFLKMKLEEQGELA